MLSVDDALSHFSDAIGIGRKGTIDNPYVLRAPFWTVDTLFFVTPDSETDINFLLALFQRVNWRAKAESTGVPSLSRGAIARTEVPVAEFLEQQQLGELFSKLDSLIGQHRRKYEQLQQVKVALAQKMFPQGDADEPELRFPGFKGPWHHRRLGGLGDAYGGLTGKTKHDFGRGEAQYVTYMDVFQHARILDDSRCGTVEIDAKQQEVRQGDALFTISSETPQDVGMAAVWFGVERNVYLNSFCFGFRPRIKLDSSFFAYLLRSSFVRAQFEVLAQGISRYNISRKKAMDIEIMLPSIPEQQRVGSVFGRLDDLISVEQRYIEKLRQVKSGLLQSMFT